MNSEAVTFSREQATDMLCPMTRGQCVADRCAMFRWTGVVDHETRAPVGHCGLSVGQP